MIAATMSDDGFNATVDCPDFDESGNQLLGNLGYWMEGIAQCSIAVLGIMFNIGSSLVLASRWVGVGMGKNILPSSRLVGMNRFHRNGISARIQFSWTTPFKHVIALHRMGMGSDDFCAMKESC